MNDYELLYLIHQHSDEAMELLLKKHERMIWSCIHHYYYRDDSDHSEISALSVKLSPCGAAVSR